MRALVLCLLLGCGAGAAQAPRQPSGPPADGSGGGSGSGDTPPGANRAADPSLGPLGETVTLVEITSENKEFKITGGGVADVDINSRIVVRVNHKEVNKVFERAAQIDPTEAATIRARLVKLVELTRTQTEANERFTALVARREAEGTTTILSEELESAVTAFNNDKEALNASIERYARSVGQDPGDYFKDDPRRALDAERRRVLQAADKLAEPTKGLRWRMQAVFAKGTPIHLDNYDTYPDGTFGLVDKLMPQTNPLEQAAQFEEARQLAKELKNLSNAKQVALKLLVTTFQEQLDSLVRALHADEVALAEKMKALSESALNITEVREVKTALVAVAGTIRELRMACSPLFEAAWRDSMDRVAPAQQASCFRALLDDAPRLIAQIPTAAHALTKLDSYIRENPGTVEELLKPLQALASGGETVQQLSEWAKQAKQVWDQLDPVRSVASTPVWTGDQQVDLPLGAVADTTIDLRRTQRKEGDLLHLRPSLVKADGSAAIVGTTSDFRVVRMGAYIDVSAGVAFVNRRDDAWGPFSTAPGVVAALHHRFRPDSRRARFMNALRPGIGIHFFNPDLDVAKVDETGAVVDDDSAVEIGIGGTVLLFGDLLQAGVGYDLQARTGYWYIGFGLDTLANLGVRFSPGG